MNAGKSLSSFFKILCILLAVTVGLAVSAGKPPEFAQAANTGAAEPIIGLNGDIDGDGKVQKEDVILLFEYCNGTGTLDEAALSRADLNEDRIVDMADVLVLYQIYSGSDHSDPGTDSSASVTTQTERPTETTTASKPTQSSGLNSANAAEIERLAFQYINNYRSSSAVWLPGLAEVAKYRSHMLISDFSHDNSREASNALQYGEYIDMTVYGYPPSENYYYGPNAEAIYNKSYLGTVMAMGADSVTAEMVARDIADGFRNSPSHWRYLSSENEKFMAVGCTFVEATYTWYCCVCVDTTNHG